MIYSGSGDYPCYRSIFCNYKKKPYNQSNRFSIFLYGSGKKFRIRIHNTGCTNRKKVYLSCYRGGEAADRSDSTSSQGHSIGLQTDHVKVRSDPIGQQTDQKRSYWSANGLHVVTTESSDRSLESLDFITLFRRQEGFLNIYDSM